MKTNVSKEKKLTPASLILVIIAILCAMGGLVSAICLLEGYAKTESRPEILSAGWDVTYNDERYTDVDLFEKEFDDVKKGDTLVITKQLPDKLPENTVMVVYEHYYDLVVELDGRELLRAETESYERGDVLGVGFRTLKLDDKDAGGVLSITMRMGEDDAFGKLAPPELWKGREYFRDYPSSKAFPISLGFFFIILGCSMTVMVVACGIRKLFRPVDMFRFAGLALFSIAFGIWMICELDITELFSDDLILKAFIKYIAFYLLPCFFMAYQFEEENGRLRTRRNIYFGILWLIDIAFFAITTMLYIFCKVGMRSSLTIMHVLSGIAIVSVLSTRIYDIVKGKKRYILSVYATIAMGIATLLSMIRYHATESNYGFSSNLLYFAMIFFVLSMFYDYMVNAMRSARVEERAEIIEKLAFTDTLTGLNNRQASENYFDVIDEGKKQYIIVQFDLNHLKKANDSYGHEAGDKYIVHFADILKASFEGRGFLARTGGDEFIFVLQVDKDDDRTWLIGVLDKLNNRLAEADTGYEDLLLSTAYGIYESKPDDGLGIREGLRIADERMYAMKKDMHALR